MGHKTTRVKSDLVVEALTHIAEGHTQKEAAVLVGMHVRTVQRWVRIISRPTSRRHDELRAKIGKGLTAEVINRCVEASRSSAKKKIVADLFNAASDPTKTAYEPDEKLVAKCSRGRVSHSKRNVALRRRAVAELHRSGLKSGEVAKTLNVSRSTVALDLKHLREELYRKNSVHDTVSIVPSIGDETTPLSLKFMEDGLTTIRPAALRFSCVYFLSFDGVVIYIGQSITPYTRIVSHLADVEFDRVSIQPVADYDRMYAEKAFIRLFQPILNDAGKGPMTQRDVELVSKITGVPAGVVQEEYESNLKLTSVALPA